MKQISETIVSQLNNESFEDAFEALVSKNPSLNHGDVTIAESLDRYYQIKEILLQAAESGALDDLPYSRRNSLSTNLKNAFQYRNSHSQLIPQIEAAYDQVLTTGLFTAQIGLKDYQAEIKELSKLKKRLSQLIASFEETEENQSLLNSTKEQLELLVESVSDNNVKVDSLKTTSENIKGEIESIKVDSETIKGEIQAVKSDIEIKKADLDAFFENIDEYKESITAIKNKAEEVVNKDKTISDLIEQAEKALQLKSAEGLSAAISTQYEEASKWQNKIGWLISAGIFVLLAIALTVWIISGWKISDPNSWSSIVGRAVAIGIAITAATFSAQRYVKQKQISEDYAYKLTLAKSIVAFTEEIKKRDDKQVAGYLTKVLDEIHQDPLRARNKPKEITLNEKSINYVEKLIDMVKSKVN